MKKNYLKTKLTYWVIGKDQIRTKRNYYRRYTKEHFRYFLNWHHRLMELSPTSISLLFYLAEQMDEITNEVYHNQATIRRYQNFRKKIGKKACSDATVRKGFQQLKRSNVIISTNEKGNYIVNPIYLYKESDEYRRICINKLLEHTKDIEWANTNLLEALGLY